MAIRWCSTFYLNCFIFDCDFEEQQGELTFRNSARWRMGPTNDEGWYRGDCRYSRDAPGWGQFYLVSGDDPGDVHGGGVTSAWSPV